MRKIAVLMALETEARPTVQALGLSAGRPLCEPMPFVWHQGQAFGCQIDLVSLGIDPATGVQLVGTQPAAVAADWIAREIKPDVLVNAGTAGGFIARGGAIGKLYLCGGPFCFHDRRIALPGYGAYGTGGYHTANVETLCQTLGWDPGTVTTGDSLDMEPADAVRIEQAQATAKDMEAAAIAWVAQTHRLPLVALKAITDLVDGEHPTETEFLANLAQASQALGRGLSELLPVLAACDLANLKPTAGNQTPATP